MKTVKKILEGGKKKKKKTPPGSEPRNLSIHIKFLVGNVCLYVVLSKFPTPPQMTMYQKWPFNKHMWHKSFTNQYLYYSISLLVITCPILFTLWMTWIAWNTAWPTNIIVMQWTWQHNIYKWKLTSNQCN